MSSTTQEDTNKPFVYVKLYITLGDADDSIEGVIVVPRDEWEADLKKFKDSLKGARSTKEIEHYDGYGFTVKPSDWEVKYASVEEAEVLKRFLGTDFSFKWPSEFINIEDVYYG
jgi:hypothetical protein